MPESAKVPGGRSPVRFSRIEQPRTHVYLAEQLRREITLGVLPTGEALPPERELAAMFGVARATIQQELDVTRRHVTDWEIRRGFENA
jgi:DNA-binding transcriptional MocR family regulator